MTYEQWAGRIIRRHVYKSNESSQSMARSLMTLARRADLHPGWVPLNLAVLVAHMRDCEALGNGLDAIRAGSWERRCEDGYGLPVEQPDGLAGSSRPSNRTVSQPSPTVTETAPT
jgi:hypothetical protein